MKNKNIKVLIITLLCGLAFASINASAMKNSSPYNRYYNQNYNKNVKIIENSNNFKIDNTRIPKDKSNSYPTKKDNFDMFQNQNKNQKIGYNNYFPTNLNKPSYINYKSSNIKKARTPNSNNNINMFYAPSNSSTYKLKESYDIDESSNSQIENYETININSRQIKNENWTNKYEQGMNVNVQKQKSNYENKEKGYNTNYDYIYEILKENEKLKKENAKLKSENTRLNNKNTKLQESVQTYKTNYEHIEQLNRKDKEDLKVKMKKFENINQKCNELVQENKKLIEKINTLEKGSYYEINKQKNFYYDNNLKNENIYKRKQFADLKEIQGEVDEKYNTHKNNLSASENKSQQLQKENKELEEKIKIMGEGLGPKNEKINQMKKRYDDLTSTDVGPNNGENINNLNNKKKRLQTEYAKLKYNLEQTDEKYNTLKNNLSASKNKSQQLQKENKELEEKINKIKEELKTKEMKK